MHELSIAGSDDLAPKRVPLVGTRMALGRAAENEISLPKDSGLSRQHLVLVNDAGVWSIQDCGSKNGTLVNGERLSKPRLLIPGDRIEAGHVTLIFDPDAVSKEFRFVENRSITPVMGGMLETRLAQVLAKPGSALSGKQQSEDADRVSALVKAGQELAGHRPLSELFQTILDLATNAVGAERGVVLASEKGDLTLRAAKGANFQISTGVRDRVMKEAASILVTDVLADESFRAMQSLVQQRVQMFMAVPLQTKDEIIGLIYVDSPARARIFSPEDLNLLTIMANIAAVRIEHARLTEMEQANRILQSDLRQAGEIQQQLLPASAPRVEGFELAGYNLPCRTVGGDYYDYLPYRDSGIAIALGDVCGKGMAAALLMASLQARLQVLIEQPGSLADLMNRLNRVTCTTCPANRFITFFLALLDTRTGALTYSNAGHNPPILLRADGSVERLEAGGPPIAILKTPKYEQSEVTLHPDDLLLVFSDGVSEAINPSDEDFGDDRLIDLLRAHRSEPAQSIIEAVRTSLHAWMADAPLADDVTLVVVRRDAVSA